MAQKSYLVESTHDFYQDDYVNGEYGDRVNFYVQSKIMAADSPMEAIKKYYQTELHREFIEENTEIYETTLHDSVTVDEDCMNASPLQIEMWKKGELKLYAEHVSIRVKQLIEINLSA